MSPTATLTMILPTELIDLIFSFLQGDMSALRACSKVHHPLFSKHAQRHLYKDIIIRTADGQAVFELYNKLSENPGLLHYPRTLEIQTYSPDLPKVHSIISMIPRMPNLKCLKLEGFPYPDDQKGDFVSVFGSCLQQSSINELILSQIDDLPLSVLDNGKTLKKLRLDRCSARKEVMPCSESDSFRRQPTTLEMLRIDRYTPDMLFWAAHRFTSLTCLELCNPGSVDWTAISKLLTAYANSLTILHLEIHGHYQSTYSYNEDLHVGHWTDDDLEFPFTLSALTRLEKLYISAPIYSFSDDPNDIKVLWTLPAIIRLVKTLPSVEDLFLHFHYVTNCDITPLSRLEWSLFDSLHSNFPGICPKICISGEASFFSISPRHILDVLAENEALMVLVDRDVVLVDRDVVLVDRDVVLVDRDVVLVKSTRIPDMLSLVFGG